MRYCIRAAELHQIGWEMCREVQAETIARLGDANGLGKLKAGECFTVTGGAEPWANEYVHKGQWTFETLLTLPPPSYTPTGATNTVEITPSGEKILGLVEVEEAKKWLRDLAVKVARNAARHLANEAFDRIRQEKPGGYIAAAIRQILLYVLKKAMTRAAEKIAWRALPRSQVRFGPQRIVTRKKIPVKHGWFIFSGRWAWKQAPGRPALPAAEWLRRYRARRNRQKKTNRTRRQTIRPPKTKYPRPKILIGFRKRGIEEWTVNGEMDRDAIRKTIIDEIEEALYEIGENAAPP